jgi:RNA polymerase sigma-70 factor, ECF subfamily
MASELEHGPALLRLAARLADGPSADDLVQSTWLRALEHRRDEVRSRPAWLRQILRNEHRMAIRGRRRAEVREQAVATAIDEPLDPEQAVEQREVAGIVAELVDALDAEIRDVVRQRYFDGHSAAEIARMHEVPAGTVRWRLKVGLDRLREQLDERYGGKRALWAGAFAPLPIAPTVSASTASQGTTVAHSTATTQGSSAMIVKSLIGKLLIGTAAVASVAGVAAWSSGGDAAAREDDPVLVGASADAPLSSTRSSVVAQEAADARERWARRVEDIRLAHERRRAAAALTAAAESPSAEAVSMCTDRSCVMRLASQLHELIRGCEALSADLSYDVTLRARIVAAPDIGALVESVELSDDSQAATALTECLTESMYTFELELEGDATDFEQEITIGLRSDRTDDDAHEHGSAARSIDRRLMIRSSSDDVDPDALPDLADGDYLRLEGEEALEHLERMGIPIPDMPSDASIVIVEKHEVK